MSTQSNQKQHGLRLDIVTIFPEYLEPLRHALLGKAIETGLLEVACHDLRQWATDVHKSVDDSPCGGGPGMVMKPTVWGPALDDVWALAGPAGESGTTTLSSSSAHNNQALRHDDIQGMKFTGYNEDIDIDVGRGETYENDASKPLLIVPTPAGNPFTQAQARSWAKEKRIVFACGRYEGIDERVVKDAAAKFRVREVSIGDYVLIGGEVAVLVIAEAVTRLVPGVLGNSQSHESDSFSDGILEGPSYTKPATWRGFAVPDVLLSGNHALIERYRRDEGLKRTWTRRPDLIAQALAAGQLTEEDETTLAKLSAHDVTTALTFYATPAEWKKTEKTLVKKLTKAGYWVDQFTAEAMSFSCEPDNMLANQFAEEYDRPPLAEELHRLVILGRTSLSDVEATAAVVACLPRGVIWYGTTSKGHDPGDEGISATCAVPLDG